MHQKSYLCRAPINTKHLFKLYSPSPSCIPTSTVLASDTLNRFEGSPDKMLAPGIARVQANYRYRAA
jgi:hypothetical protein